MIKAIVQNGVLVPREPLPADWREGTEVEVERTTLPGATSEISPTDRVESTEEDELTELDRVCEEFPIFTQGIRLTRDQLHDRR